MRKTALILFGALLFVASGLAIAGCADDVRTTKTITTHEEDPVRMVSPGTEVVE